MMFSQIDSAASNAPSTSCHTSCVVCARLARYADTDPQSQRKDPSPGAHASPDIQTPRKSNQQSQPFPNPYITPPREFVRAVHRLKGMSDGQEEKNSDLLSNSQEHINRRASENGNSHEAFTETGVDLDEDDEDDTVTETNDDGQMSQLKYHQDNTPHSHSKPKYEVGDAVFIISSGSACRPQRKYGPLTVAQTIHNSEPESVARMSAGVESHWYYHLKWDVMEDINWAPDKCFWRENRLEQ